MSDRRIPISEAKGRLSALVNRVAYGGERVILVSHGKPKAALVSLDDLETLQSGTGRTRLVAERLETLQRIAGLAERIQKARAGRKTGDVAEELAAMREERDDELARAR